MSIFFAVAQATFLLVVAFFVLHFALKSEGRLKLFGQVLSGWLLLIAAIFVVGLVTAPFFGGRPFGMVRMGGPRGDMMMRQDWRLPASPGPQGPSIEPPAISPKPDPDS